MKLQPAVREHADESALEVLAGTFITFGARQAVIPLLPAFNAKLT